MRPAIVLGLDVSRDRMGWGVVDFLTGEALACGMEPLAPMYGKLKGDGFDPARPGQMEIACSNIGCWADEVTMTYLEAPYAGKSGQVTVELALTVGSAWQCASQVFGRVELLQPREWKRLAEVPGDPREGRKALKGVALRNAVIEHYAAAGRPELSRAIAMAKPEKPHVYARAVDLGFSPWGNQDAADAGCIAVAGRLRSAELFAMAA